MTDITWQPVTVALSNLTHSVNTARAVTGQASQWASETEDNLQPPFFVMVSNDRQ